MAAATQIQSAKGAVVPLDVVKRLRDLGMVGPTSGKLRGIVRRMREKRLVRSDAPNARVPKKRAKTWSAEFLSYAASLESDAVMKVKSIVHKDCVASFSIVAEGLLAWLKELHSEDPLSMLCSRAERPHVQA